MKTNKYTEKIHLETEFPQEQISHWKAAGECIVFTNGCFDLLHRGHVAYLYQAASLGDRLIVGLNTDASVRKLKGQGRPVQDQVNRSEILASLQMVDLVILFGGNTPIDLILKVRPEVLVKGGDWPADQIVGYNEVTAYGGKVQTLGFIEGESTSSIIRRIRETEG